MTEKEIYEHLKTLTAEQLIDIKDQITFLQADTLSLHNDDFPFVLIAENTTLLNEDIIKRQSNRCFSVLSVRNKLPLLTIQLCFLLKSQLLLG